MSAISTTNNGGNPGPKGINNSVYNNLDPAKYTSLGDFIDEVNAPDSRAELVKTFGDQGITGLLQMTGAVTSQGTADEVTYWEEARLHQKLEGKVKAALTGGNSTSIVIDTNEYTTFAGFDEATDKQTVARVGDIVLVNNDERGYVVSVGAAATAADGNDVTISAITGVFSNIGINAVVSYPIVGNMYAQGTDQPDRFLQSNVVKRTNPYAIVKEVYKVSGSQATNIGYIDVGGGDYRWYLKSEQDTRQRFLDKREMTMILGQKATVAAVSTTAKISGTEGYFAAIEDRGMVTDGIIGATATDYLDLDGVITEMDKNGCPSEYAMYCNTAQSLKFDTMLANGGAAAGTGGVAGNYGAFNNDRDMALNLGFQSATRGGYTFHKHSWKLLNDPTLLDGAGFAGVMTPLAKVTDAKSGAKVAALELNYKSANGYSRELEHWVTGGGVLGFANNGKDAAEFNYRSECALVTRAANQHVLIKTA